MWIFWVAAAATSSFTYLDLCDACPVNEVYYSNFLFACNSNAFLDNSDIVYPRGVTSFPRGLAGMEKRAATVRRSKGLTAAGRTALDSIMTCVFCLNWSSIKLIQTTKCFLQHLHSGNNLVGFHSASILGHRGPHDETACA